MSLVLVMMKFSLSLTAQTYVRSLEHIDLSSFKSYDTLTFNYRAAFSVLSNRPQNADLILDFGKYGRYNLILSPSNLLIQNSKQDDDNHHWKGMVNGTNQMVRINAYNNALSGLITLQENHQLSFETVSYNNRYLLLIYYNDDFINHTEQMHCGHKDNLNKNPVMQSPLKRSSDTAYTEFSCAIIKVAAVCSHKFLKKNNYDSTSAFNEMKDIINLADGAYAKYIGVRLKIATFGISMDSLSQMNNSLSTITRINDFESIMYQFKGTMRADIYHIFTEAFTSTDGAVGRGALGGACEDNRVSLSVEYSTMLKRALIFAHEIGHNLSADHNHGNNCSSTTLGSIMCPTTVSNNLIFNSTEIEKIQNFIKYKLMRKSDCMTYPLSNNTNTFFIDLMNNDSVKIFIEKMGDYYLDGWYHNDESYKKAVGGENIWVKQPGFYRVMLNLDTNNNLLCNQQVEYFAPSKDFTVTTTNEYGYGSLKAAILNANYNKGKDTIRFRLSNSISVFDITSPLPPITDHCLIDGTTQPGYQQPDSSGYYRPGIVLNNKDLTGASYPSGLLIGYGDYEIRGLEFHNFYFGITNSENVKLGNKYAPLMPPVSNTSSNTSIKACQFRNNETGIYVYFSDTIKNNDKFTIGTGAFKDANFFKTLKGDGIYLNRIDSAYVNGNYFGAEPGADSMGSINQGIYLSTVYNAYVKNNYFSNSRMYGYNSSGNIYGNVFGYDPFLKRRTSTPYSAITLTGFSANGKNMLIGGTAPGQGNSIYRQKRYMTYGGAPILIFDIKNVRVAGNRIEQSDSGAIMVQNTSSSTVYIPFKSIRIDSVSHHCITGIQRVYGRVKPQYANDSFDLHFYSAPPGVKKNKEPMHDYLGTMKLLTTDTLEKAFVFTAGSRYANEGVCFTATSATLQLTGNQSEVVYPTNNSTINFVKRNDTCLCPRKVLELQQQSGFSNYQVNNASVSEMKFSQPGYYTISAEAQGCRYRTALELTTYPDYLANVHLVGTNKYKALQNYDFNVNNISRPWGWSTYLWKGNNYSLVFGTRTLARAYFLNDSAMLEYQITDINQCTYSIAKKLYNEKPSTSIETLQSNNGLSVYPNPLHSGVLTLAGVQARVVKLYNATGQLILELNADGDTLELALDDLENGLYLIQTTHQGAIRFIKN